VVSDADSITVTLGDGRKFDATVVGTDPKTEVALIKIEDSGDLPFLTLGDSDALQVGEWVLAAGNPFGLSQTITAGIVSAKERSEVGITDYANFIQTDAAVNPGNSGGPLLNIHGEVIGINTAIISQNGSYAGNVGIGFAIPINQAKPIKDQLIASGRISRSMLGIYIQEVDDELAKSFGLAESAGILIGQVMEGSAAEEAGLESGDVILELNGEKVGKIGSFRSRVAAIPPNSKVDLQIFRDGQSRSITAVTKAMDEEPVALADNDTSILERLGLSVENRPEDAEASNRFGSRNQGVVVAEVEEDGPAWAAGLRPGNIISSVNRRLVEDVDEFVMQLNRGAASGRVLLLVSDGRASRFVVLPLE
jgi:serine protease Do